MPSLAAGCRSAGTGALQGGSLVLAVGPGLASEAARIAAAYAAGPGVSVRILAAGEDPVQLVRSGAAGVVLVCALGGGSPGIDSEALPGPVVELKPGSLRAATVGRLPLVAGVDAFGPRPPLSLGQALDIASGRAVDGLPPVSLVRLADLGPALAGLEVEGVRPTPESVTSGRYPLAVPVAAFWAGNLPSFPARVWTLLAGLQDPETARFVRWLGGDAAQEALLGVGDLVTMAAVGDVMLDRGIARLAESLGPDYPFEACRDILTGADLAVCNLESAPATGGSQVAGKGIWFRATPGAAAALARAGFDLVSLANNHALDYGRSAFLESLSILDGLGIAYCGGGRDAAGARAPAVLERRGLRVAFLGYSEFAELYWTADRFSFDAGEGRPGVAPLRRPYGVLSLSSVKRANGHLDEDIARARQAADVVVASVHWGPEYTNEPDRFQQLAGQALLDAGADLVLGHHPHAIQGLCGSGRALVAFSLGNFVFDQKRDVTTESMVLLLELSRKGVFSWEVLPVRIVGGQPRPAPGTADGEEISAKVRRLSLDLRASLGQ